jgi:hypothetical protein
MDLNRTSLVQAGINPPTPRVTLMCLINMVTQTLVH